MMGFHLFSQGDADGTAALSARTVTSQGNTGPRLAQIAFRESGDLETRVTDAAWNPITGEWFLTGNQADMEVIVTTISGSPSANPLGWVSGVAEALGVALKQWERIQTVPNVGFETWTASYEIKDISSGNTLAGPVTIPLRARIVTI